jgi:hypothetical protein
MRREQQNTDDKVEAEQIKADFGRESLSPAESPDIKESDKGAAPQYSEEDSAYQVRIIMER